MTHIGKSDNVVYIDADAAKVDHVVVYGTLMCGQSSHKLMSQCTLAGVVKVPGTMYSLLDFPGIKLIGDTPCRAEIYALPRIIIKRRLILRRMDEYEGVPALYTRRIVDVIHKGETVPAFIYEVNGEYEASDIIPSGNWLAHLRELDKIAVKA